MNKLMAVLYFVLSLYGCDAGGSSVVHRSRVDGADTLYSKAQARAGSARFDCLVSASGQCHYTVYRRECAATVAVSTTAPHTGAGRCATPLQRFSVAAGASRQVPGLQHFAVCVSVDAATPGPECEPPNAIAAL